MNIQYKYSTLALSVTACTWLISGISHAAPVPNAGQLLQQQQQLTLSAPQAAVDVESTQAQLNPNDSDLQIPIRKIIIEGNRQFSTAQLQALVADAENKSMNLTDLRALAQRLTGFYHSQGYIYSQAYLPQQTLSDGVLKIAILEAVYDQTQINNQSRTQDWLLAATKAPLKQGSHIEQEQMQHQLKLLNRLNGVSTRNVLTPGTTTGSSQLNIDVQDTALVTGYVGADNFGNRYTGEARLTAGVALNNLAGLGDQLSVEGMTTGPELNYGKVGYDFAFTGMGTRAGVSYSYLDYELGKELENIGAEGSAAQTSVWLSQPVLLSNTAELSVSLQYDHKQLEDDINLNQYYKHRDIDLITARLDGAQYDQGFGGGLNQYGASSSYGRVTFKNDNAQALDAQGAHTQGNFYHVSANLSRLQNLGSKGTQAYAGIYGQYSPYNLDNAEQYLGGGPYNVRGYESSQLAGSSGYYVNLELRQNLLNNAKNLVGGKVFIDTTEMTLNADRWAGLTGSNKARLSSAGLGLNWSSALNIQASAEVAFPIGSTPEQLQSRDDSQYWLSLRKTF